MTQAADAPLVCPRCSATIPPGRVRCWLCEVGIDPAKAAAAPLPPPSSSSPSSSPSSSSTPAGAARYSAGSVDPAAVHGRFSFSMSSLLLVTTLAAICAALVAAAPGLGIPICVLLAPVLVRTAMVVKQRERRGRPVSAAGKAALIGTSLLVAVVISVVVAAAAFLTFCLSCVGAVSLTGGNFGSEFAVAAAVLATLSVVVLLGVKFAGLIRARYRHDVDGDL